MHQKFNNEPRDLDTVIYDNGKKHLHTKITLELNKKNDTYQQNYDVTTKTYVTALNERAAVCTNNCIMYNEHQNKNMSV